MVQNWWRRYLFETLYQNRYLYQLASTIPFAGQWRTWQRLVLSRLHGYSVLELGCGLGDLMADMIEAGYDCRAIEKSPEMVAAAQSKLQQRQCGQVDWIIEGEAQYLPFGSSSFDTVVSTFPSEYIFEPQSISEVKRVLRSGGRLIVVVGANLLTVDPMQLFMLLSQSRISESNTLWETSHHGNQYNDKVSSQSVDEPRFRMQNITINTEPISNIELGRLIPLEKYGFRYWYERVYSQYWEAFIAIGEK